MSTYAHILWIGITIQLLFIRSSNHFLFVQIMDVHQAHFLSMFFIQSPIHPFQKVVMFWFLFVPLYNAFSLSFFSSSLIFHLSLKFSFTLKYSLALKLSFVQHGRHFILLWSYHTHKGTIFGERRSFVKSNGPTWFCYSSFMERTNYRWCCQRSAFKSICKHQGH